MVRRRRVHRVLDQPELFHPFHGHHRRARKPAGRIPGCGADLHSADCAALRAAPTRTAPKCGHGRAYDVHDHGRIDRAVLDRRAGRARAVVADRQAEIEGVAVSILMVQDMA